MAIGLGSSFTARTGDVLNVATTTGDVQPAAGGALALGLDAGEVVEKGAVGTADGGRRAFGATAPKATAAVDVPATARANAGCRTRANVPNGTAATPAASPNATSGPPLAGASFGRPVGLAAYAAAVGTTGATGSRTPAQAIPAATAASPPSPVTLRRDDVLGSTVGAPHAKAASFLVTSNASRAIAAVDGLHAVPGRFIASAIAEAAIPAPHASEPRGHAYSEFFQVEASPSTLFIFSLGLF